jgi:RNA polymerase sigma-70 factor (ECF subfamily)
MLAVQNADFLSTQWSLVLAARDRSTPEGNAALAALCGMYWMPLYAYVRRRGFALESAQDLTQSFFARLLEKDGFRYAERERGKLRSFLLASLKNFLANEWDREHAEKRGGGMEFVSMQAMAHLESGYAADDQAGVLSAERLYERTWALTLLERATTRLMAEYTDAGKHELIEHLKPFLAGDGSGVDYAEIARAVNMSEGAARVAVHRMRKRLRDLLRSEIAQTLENPEDANAIEEELRALIAAV